MWSSLLALAVLSAPAPVIVADSVVTNARIWTGDADQPSAEALAVWQGKLIAVGKLADIQLLIGPKTTVLDATGARLVPGFHDSHVHFLGGGLQLARVELKDCKDEAEFNKRITEFHDKTSSERWMQGGNWDHERAFNGVLPTAELLDKLVKNRPVFLRRYDGHMGLANSAALKLANITADTKDPDGGVIGRMPDGKTPNGILKDNAMDLVAKFIPEPPEDELVEGVRAAMAECAKYGITSVTDMDGSGTTTRNKLFRILQRLDRKDDLTVRIDLRWPIAEQKELSQLGVEAGFGTRYLRVGGLKGYMDGSLGSSTAKMFEPYVSDAKVTGVFVTKPDDMQALVRKADADRLAVCVHAIGDEANARLLDLYAAVAKANGVRDRRFRIEHVQHLRPDDYKRFKQLNVVASMQPYHVVDDARWAEGRIGPKRCESSYAFRSLLDNGATLAFGSDWPVVTLDVLAGVDAAVNRRGLDGKTPNGWIPAQRITVEESLKAYTAGSAYASGVEKNRGMLKLGYDADFVLLDSDILEPKNRDTIIKTKVTTTVVGGRVVDPKP